MVQKKRPGMARGTFSRLFGILLLLGAGPLFFYGAQYSMNVIYGALAMIGIAIVFIVTGARERLRKKERPEFVLGAYLQITDPVGLGPDTPAFPPAVATAFKENTYRLEFVEPFEFEGRHEDYVVISARSALSPVSGVKKSGILDINGMFESGAGFVASLVRL